MESSISLASFDTESLKINYQLSFILRLAGGVCIITAVISLMVGIRFLGTENQIGNMGSENPIEFIALAPLLAFGAYGFYKRTHFWREYGLFLCLIVSAVGGYGVLFPAWVVAWCLIRGEKHFGPNRMRLNDLKEEMNRRKHASGVEHILDPN